MLRLFSILTFLSALSIPAYTQVDTMLLYNPVTPYGQLDIRLSKGADQFYYLEENKTFSFRSNNGVPTGTYLDMTAWDSSPYSEGHMRERDGSKDLFVMNYRMLSPQNYSDAFAGGYPLIVVLHGLLERGNCGQKNCYHANSEYSPNLNEPPASTAAGNMLLNNDYNLIHAGLDYLEASLLAGSTQPGDVNLPAGAFPGFVLFPQNLNGWDASASHDVIRIVRLLVKKYNIDAERIYVNGISHGGHGAYELMKRAPWMFAAGVLFSSADEASVISQKVTGAISGIPLWIFQGGLDENPTQSKTENYIRAFRRAGATIRYTLYPGLGHGTWNEALDEPDYFSWLLAQRRNKIHVNGGKAIVCSTSQTGTLLSLPKGFRDYEWELNGSVIADANANNYLARQAGVFRGRFRTHDHTSEGTWSDWSRPLNVEVSKSASPELGQVGTLLLPDLNGNSNAELGSIADYPFYYWYKEGKHLSLFGDTLKSISLDPEMGNGAYSLRVAGYDKCKSEESKVKHVAFNNEAPIDLSAPFELQVKAVSPSEIFLSWSDTSVHETGFEIWRRSKDASGTLSPWVMPALTEATAVSYQDKGLQPGSTYHYKIRAISASSRSDYEPEGAAKIEVITPPDREAPTAPQALSAAPAGVNEIRLSWKASRDNSSVEQYIITHSADSVFTNSADTTFLLTNLELNTDYSFKVRAKDPSGNLSAESNVAQANTFMNGLYYEHSTGAWENVSMIDWSFAEFRGTAQDFTLSPRTQEDFFNFKFDGYLNIEKAGVYQFRLTSDDGSTFDLNDTLLIENDGIHTINTVTGPIQVLRSGPQRVTLKYFDYSLSDTLLVEYKGPDSNGEWIKIPPEVLTSELVTSVAAENDAAFDFVVFPNPARDDNIGLEISSDRLHPIEVKIIDLTGKLVYSSDHSFHRNLKLEFSDDLKNGMYIIWIMQDGRRLAKKMIVH